MQRLAAGLIFMINLLAPVAPAMADRDSVPVLNFAPSCLEARQYAGQNQNLTYQGCMKDEKDARAELARKWAHFKAEDRRDCLAQGATPMPSYVELLTCLEMSEEAGALYNPNGTARAKSLSSKEGLSAPASAAPLNDLPPTASPPASEALPAPDAIGTPPAPGLGQ